jgi:hypothetical protein
MVRAGNLLFDSPLNPCSQALDRTVEAFGMYKYQVPGPLPLCAQPPSTRHRASSC